LLQTDLPTGFTRKFAISMISSGQHLMNTQFART
jgi:hypothetical protein